MRNSLHKKSGSQIFMPPLKKGAYCFATVGRLVCRSVGRSVDHVLSAQYLLTPSIDQYQTWCRGCPQWVDDPYWFSRSHVQRSRSNHSSQPMVLSAQYLLTPSLDLYQTWCRGWPQWVDDPYWFTRSHVQRSRSNFSSEPSVLSTIYILIPCLLALDRFSFYREDKPEFCSMGGIYVSEAFLVTNKSDLAILKET